MANLTLREKFCNITGLTFDPQVLLDSVKTSTDAEKIKVLKKFVWFIPDGAFRDNNVDLIEIDADFITDVIDELEIENVFSYFEDTNGDGVVDIYDIINAPSQGPGPEPEPVVPNDEIWYTATSKLTPYTTSALPNIVSNEYDSTTGKGVFKFSTEVTAIGNNAFDGRNILTSMSLPNSVASLGTLIFRDCRNLTSVNIPNGITQIGGSDFYNCISLESIELPDSITNIGGSAFYNCSSLTSVIIPANVTQITGSAFYGCNSLTSITCKRVNPPTIGKTVFDVTNRCPIYVPAESVEAYKSAVNWANYASRIEAISE